MCIENIIFLSTREFVFEIVIASHGKNSTQSTLLLHDP